MYKFHITSKINSVPFKTIGSMDVCRGGGAWLKRIFGEEIPPCGNSSGQQTEKACLGLAKTRFLRLLQAVQVYLTR